MTSSEHELEWPVKPPLPRSAFRVDLAARLEARGSQQVPHRPDHLWLRASALSAVGAMALAVASLLI